MGKAAKPAPKKTVVIAGANWCPHCHHAVESQGGSFKGNVVSGLPANEKWVDCADKKNAATCNAMGVKAYPTFFEEVGPAEVAQQSGKKVAF